MLSQEGPQPKTDHFRSFHPAAEVLGGLKTQYGKKHAASRLLETDRKCALLPGSVSPSTSVSIFSLPLYLDFSCF